MFRTKYKPNSDVSKYKAMLVAKGYSQEYRSDYEEIFTPVVRMETVRLMFALTAQNSCLVY